MTQLFDFDKALKALQEGQALTGKDGILTPLMKQLTEAALAAELDSHLTNDTEANRRNGSTKKTIKAPTGSFELTTPRDRNGSFEPQLVKKHQTSLSNEIEQKIIRLFALGVSYADISREIEDLYAFSVSAATISAVTDKIIPELKQWQQRPLEAIYPFIWLLSTIKSVRTGVTSVKQSILFWRSILKAKKRFLASICLKVKGLTSGCPS